MLGVINGNLVIILSHNGKYNSFKYNDIPMFLIKVGDGFLQ